ncbi:MAG: acyl-CoA desaturase, partial [Bdellovibrionota bacterium]
MPFLARVLEPPTYGFTRDGVFYKPTTREMWREFGLRLNLFRSRKNWLTVWGWFTTWILAVPLYFFFAHYFSWKLLAIGFVYSMVILGSYGTVWLHRYGTHRGFTFKHPIWAFFVRNLVIKIVPEETYIISHHVHHKFSEQPGDPYNVNGGWLYCFLADATHQPIAQGLNETDYQRVSGLIEHTGVHRNSYVQYQYWGSI